MRVAGVVIILGGLLWLAGFLCLPYATFEGTTYTGAQIALALTHRAAPQAPHAMVPLQTISHWLAVYAGYRWYGPALVGTWWLWWIVLVLGIAAVVLGATLLPARAQYQLDRSRLLAAAAVEAGAVGLIILLYLGTWLYAPQVFTHGTPCVWCDAREAAGQAYHLGGAGYWATLEGMAIVVIGGAIAIAVIAAEQRRRYGRKHA